MANPSSKPEFDDPNVETALFRHGLIAALIHHPPDNGRLEEALRVLAAQTYQIPHSKRTRVSLTSLRRYLAAYRTHGFEALLPKTRRDAGQPRAFDPAVIAQAIALRDQQPDRTTPMIAEILKREGQVINAHTLDTHLRRAGKTRRLLRATPKPYQRFEREHVNSLWQSDASHGPWLPDPQQPDRMRRTHLIGFIDDHSRLVPYAEFFFDEALPRLERVFKVAMLRRGVPDAVYVDNGAIFNATQFRAACATLRTEVIYASPFHPRGKGKIEQLWHQIQTLFYPEVEASHITDLATLNQSLWAWLDRIYHVHTHGETGQSPLDRFAAGAASIRTVDPETLRLAFQWRTQRTVTRQATISFQGNLYHVDPVWCGQVIELRYDPFDLAHLDVYDRYGRHLGLATLSRHKHQYHLAVQKLVPETLRRNPPAQLDFLKTLREEHELALRLQIGTLRFAALDSNSNSNSNSNAQD